MAVLFIGHGSPMNAIEENEYTKGWKQAADKIGTPKGIICVSAHWVTRGTQITGQALPRQIFDFYGFPKALYEAGYPVPGNPELAERVEKALAVPFMAARSEEWGIDHGTWSVLRSMYPEADVPTIQISLDTASTPEKLYALGEQLIPFAEEGYLIMGSGNIVHNLMLMDDSKETPFVWAKQFNTFVLEQVETGDIRKLMNWQKLGSPAQLAVPTAEHFFPLFVALGAAKLLNRPEIFNDRYEAGSLSMSSILFQ